MTLDLPKSGELFEAKHCSNGPYTFLCVEFNGMEGRFFRMKVYAFDTHEIEYLQFSERELLERKILGHGF